MAAAQTKRETLQGQARQCLQAHGYSIGPDDKGNNIPREVLEQCAPGDVRAKDPRFHRERLKGVLQGVSGVLAIVAWALGASRIGAEFASRSMTTLLTWETRRWRVFVAKAAVALTATALLAVVVLALTSLAMLPAMVWHGAPVTVGEPTPVGRSCSRPLRSDARRVPDQAKV